MASNKINVKSKLKDDRSKSGKVGNATCPVNENVNLEDLALLRKPIMTSITGFAQARKVFDVATEELKELISNECDLLYECKVCRNIFRSLANFLSHKRVFCREKFNAMEHGHFMKTSLVNELLKIKHLEDGFQESLKANRDVENEDDQRIPLSKDLSEVMEKILKYKGVPNKVCNEDVQVATQKISTSDVAVFQNIKSGDTKSVDEMRSQVEELENMLAKDKGVLQENGEFTVEKSKVVEKLKVIENGKPNADTVIQISDDEDADSNTNILKCKICNLQFSTQKTLKFHMKYKHLESRLVYPCPDCVDIFSTSWSVYRHLFKVHRKTAQQIRRLRESIQSKAFKMNNPPAFYERRKNVKASNQKIMDEKRLEDNQAWMDNIEGDSEVPRCGGCGRMFERRAALVAHTNTCQPRNRALARRPENTNKKIEIQIRKDYNKTSATVNKPLDNDVVMISPPKQPAKQVEETTPTRDNSENPSEENSMDSNDKDIGPNNIIALDEEQTLEELNDELLLQNDSLTNEENLNMVFYKQTVRKNLKNLTALRHKMQPDIDSSKLLCKKCNSTFPNIIDLCEHMANHYNWTRYGCKLCNYKHYTLSNLPEHIKTVHKLRGNVEFYYSTVKAVDVDEAMTNDLNEDSNEMSESSSRPSSRRPSRCSSDSSKLSDNDSSSNTRTDPVIFNHRKRKPTMCNSSYKKKKQSPDKEGKESANALLTKAVNAIIFDETEIKEKPYEENSSDLDLDEEKIIKKAELAATSEISNTRRPVRKRTKPKNEDFEYDLSNLLKMEAQGYRESLLFTNKNISTNARTTQTKKKVQSETPGTEPVLNKAYCGALLILSKEAVENSRAQMKIANYNIFNDDRSSQFVKPTLPKIVNKYSNTSEKCSTKKEVTDTNNESGEIPKSELNKEQVSEEVTVANEDSKTVNPDPKPNNSSNPVVLPVKFRRQSMEVLSSPLLTQKLAEYPKTGLTTKILVIKPINRNKEGVKSLNTPLKFKTIKLKSGQNTGPNNSFDQQKKLKIVKVPPVDFKTDTKDINCDTKEAPTNSMDKTVNNVTANNVTVEKRVKMVVQNKLPEETVPNENANSLSSQDETPLTTNDNIEKKSTTPCDIES